MRFLIKLANESYVCKEEWIVFVFLFGVKKLINYIIVKHQDNCIKTFGTVFLKWNMSQSPQKIIAREIMHKSRRYQLSRKWIVRYFKLLTSDTPHFFC